MTHTELRKNFLEYFKSNGHETVASSSLLPKDSSVLFTTAGMQQFKPYYLEEKSPHGDKIVSVQKCIRTSDIEEVGDESHLTFFEMLGNFSFWNAYFKKEAIEYGYEFIVKELGVPLDRITISVFRGDPGTNIPPDNESLEIWKNLGISEDKIFFGGRDENFWGPTGDKGPCGPTTEIYIDGIEIWNIVFNEYFCEKNHGGEEHILPLTHKGIDTGMGLERLAVILQRVKNVFETDLFVPIMEEIRGKDLYDYEQNARTERIIADHLKASIFLICDGVSPSNTGEGYVLRRLLRTAIRHVKLLGLPDDVYERVLYVISGRIYKDIYPELAKKEKEILKVIKTEEEKFGETLNRGLREVGKMMDGILKRGNDVLSGYDAFTLYSSFGFPIELIEEMAAERKINVDRVGFEKEVQKHKEKSRKGAEKKFGGHGLTDELEAGTSKETLKTMRLHTAAHLLHAALRKLFGENIRQKGSDITPERLRFDFTFPGKMTDAEKKTIEDEVNRTIEMDLDVTMEEMPFEDAVKSGALHFFREKYSDRVKVYSIGDYSKELCGGPHVKHTGEIGKFKIIKEESASGGIRRIRADVK